MRAKILTLLAVVCLYVGQRAEGATYTVIMTNFAFVPKTININQGDTITWINRDAAGHDAVSGANKVPSGVWTSPMLANGESWSFTFSNVAAGNYPYYCTPHVFAPNYMTGLVVVAQSTVNLAPSVGITSPTNNMLFVAPANFTIQASASDSDGSVAQVEFFNGTVSLGVDTTSPYTAAVNNLSAGTYSLAAVATDNLGAKATNSVTVTVDAPPTVTLTSPANNATFTAGANITLQASANDTDGTVTKVEFFADNYLRGTATTAPYTFTWTGVPAGSYSLTAKATDNQGATALSSAVSITVNPANIPPTVAITSPSDNTVFIAPASFTLQATASDSDGSVAQVEFFNGATSLGADTSSPYTAPVSSLSAGTYTLSAVATDNLGAKATSSVTVVVDAPPTVSFTSPANNATFTSGANITLQASAADSDGSVTKVEFFAGATLLGTATSSPYSFTWTAVPAGSYSLTAKATDNAGATATSSAVNISVTNNTAGPVSLLNPTVNGNNISFSFATQTGVSYAVQFTDSLSPITWQALTNFTGNGASFIVTDTTAAAERFYRVSTQ